MTTLNTDQDPRHAVDNPMASGWYRSIPLAAVILGFGVVAANYFSLPDQIPMHFNGSGAVDDYGHKFMLWILPVINFGLFGALGWVPKASFGLMNYPVTVTEENAAEQHRIALQLIALLRVVCCLMIAYLCYAIVRSAQTESSQLNMWLFGGLLVTLFGVIGWGMFAAYKAK